MNDPIDALVPRQRLSTLLDFLPDRKEAGLTERYTVTVCYETDGISRRRWAEPLTYRYVLDMEQFYGTHFLEEKGIHQLAKSVEDLHRTIKSWTDSTGVRVYYQSLVEGRKQEERWYRRQQRRRRQEENADNTSSRAAIVLRSVGQRLSRKMSRVLAFREIPDA